MLIDTLKQARNALNYWLPDEILIPEGYVEAWHAGIKAIQAIDLALKKELTPDQPVRLPTPFTLGEWDGRYPVLDATGVLFCRIDMVGYSRALDVLEALNAPMREPDIDELQAEIARLEKLVYVPGLWKCAKCNCQTICTNLHLDGGFSANNSPQQCPNECGPMWRVTERDAGNELIDRMEKLTKPTSIEVEAGK